MVVPKTDSYRVGVYPGREEKVGEGHRCMVLVKRTKVPKERLDVAVLSDSLLDAGQTLAARIRICRTHARGWLRTVRARGSGG